MCMRYDREVSNNERQSSGQNTRAHERGHFFRAASTSSLVRVRVRSPGLLCVYFTHTYVPHNITTVLASETSRCVHSSSIKFPELETSLIFPRIGSSYSSDFWPSNAAQNLAVRLQIKKINNINQH